MNDLNQQLFDCFRKVSATLRRNAPMGPEGGPRPIPNSQNRVLTILNEKDGISQKQLAYILGIRPQSLGELVNKMESNGFLEKKVDENDKRFSSLYLTNNGRQRANSIDLDNDRECPFDVLNEEEKENLIILLNKVIDGNYDVMDKMEHFDRRPQPPLPPHGEFGPHHNRPRGFSEGPDDFSNSHRPNMHERRLGPTQGKNMPFRTIDNEDDEKEF